MKANDVKTLLKKGAFKVLRILGILLVIYVSMVFYLALTERRNAFPRAIYHKEANEAIKGTASPLTCNLPDGTTLEGYSLGNEKDPVLLYFPEADEDAAQFLAQTGTIPGVMLITFNYRGSGNNKGTPSAENFESDASQITECATQVNGNPPLALAGRGTGAILAAEQRQKGQKIIFIDPVFDIADAITEKYRLLYPKFLVRTNVRFDTSKLNSDVEHTFVLYDRKNFEERTRKQTQNIKEAKIISRNGESLRSAIEMLLQISSAP